MLTQERLKELFHYDPETGAFTRLTGIKAGKVYLGKECCNTASYILILVDGKPYASHQLAFLYMLGHFPEYLVDHINGIRYDNRWCNLRDVKQCDNAYNSRKRRNCPSNSIDITRSKPYPFWTVIRVLYGERKCDYFKDSDYGGIDGSFIAATKFIKEYYYEHGIIDRE